MIKNENSKEDVNSGIISRRDLLRMGIATTTALTFLPLANSTDLFAAQNTKRDKSGRDKNYVVPPAANLDDTGNCGNNSGDVNCETCYDYLISIVKSTNYLSQYLNVVVNAKYAPNDLANLAFADSTAISACQHATVGNSQKNLVGTCASRDINDYYHGNFKLKQQDVIYTYVKDLIDNTLKAAKLPSYIRNAIENRLAWLMINGLQV